MRRSHPAQRGIAVITVLLALAIAVLISSEVIMRVYNGMKRSQNDFNSRQAWEYALGGEAWARQVLEADYEKDKKTKKVDHFQEDWALPAEKQKVEGGFIEVEIYDMQSQFNLNNLVDDKGVPIKAQVVLLSRLMSYVGVRPMFADLAARWASYADDTDNMYEKEDYPFHAADTQFGSVTELQQLRDIEMVEYQRMSSFLCVLPQPVKININTASEPVLAALAGNGQQVAERLKSFMQQRSQQPNGYPSPHAFMTVMGIQTNDAEQMLSVSSEYFRVRVIAEYNGRRTWLDSTLYRDSETGEISLLARDTSLRFTLGNFTRDKDSKHDKDADLKEDKKDGKKDRKSSRDKNDSAEGDKSSRDKYSKNDDNDSEDPDSEWRQDN